MSLEDHLVGGGQSGQRGSDSDIDQDDAEDHADEHFVYSDGSVDVEGLIRTVFYGGIIGFVLSFIDAILTTVYSALDFLNTVLSEAVDAIAVYYGVPQSVMSTASSTTATYLELFGVAAWPIAALVIVATMMLIQFGVSSYA